MHNGLAFNDFCVVARLCGGGNSALSAVEQRQAELLVAHHAHLVGTSLVLNFAAHNGGWANHFYSLRKNGFVAEIAHDGACNLIFLFSHFRQLAHSVNALNISQLLKRETCRQRVVAFGQILRKDVPASVNLGFEVDLVFILARFLAADVPFNGILDLRGGRCNQYCGKRGNAILKDVHNSFFNFCAKLKKLLLSALI